MPKFLVIRLSSIGDIVLASPVLRSLKRQVENAEVHFVTKESFKAVTIANPYIDKFFYYNDNLDELVEQLKIEEYDHVIDLHRNFRSSTIRRKLGRPSHTIDKLSTEKFLLTKLNIDIMPKRHITHRSLDTVRPLGIKDDGLGLDYFIPPDSVVSENDIPTSHHAGFIALVIGASYATKKMPVHKLQELCVKIDHPLILLGGKEDIPAGEAIASVDPVKVYNACGKFSLNESADLVRQSKFVISHDTGLQYIACAFRKRVIALWGATSPRLQVEPYYGLSFMSQQETPPYVNFVLNLRCQPCSKYGQAKCPLEHFNCMEKQDIDAIVGQVNQWLGNRLTV